MNIEPGTRVRIVPSEIYPDEWVGTFLSSDGYYYDIKWDEIIVPFLHTEDEFEAL